MKRKVFWLVILVISVLLFAGCQKDYTLTPVDVSVEQTTPEETVDDVVSSDSEEPVREFKAGELGEVDELALGSLLLEDTGDAISPDQAVSLLSLWQVIRSGSLKSQAETDAVMNQITGLMTDGQLMAIETLELTQADLTAWVEEQGVDMSVVSPGDGSQKGDMSDEERADMREQSQNMTEEERAEKRAEMGLEMPEGAGWAGARGGNVLLIRLIELLNARVNG